MCPLVVFPRKNEWGTMWGTTLGTIGAPLGHHWGTMFPLGRRTSENLPFELPERTCRLNYRPMLRHVVAGQVVGKPWGLRLPCHIPRFQHHVYQRQLLEDAVRLSLPTWLR